MGDRKDLERERGEEIWLLCDCCMVAKKSVKVRPHLDDATCCNGCVKVLREELELSDRFLTDIVDE